MFQRRVLGIDPGARQIGISVFYGHHLVFFRVKTIKQRNSTETLKRLQVVLKKLIKTHKINYVALGELAFVQQQRSAVPIVYNEIKESMMYKKIEVLEYRPELVRSYICGGEFATRQKTSQILAQKHKELSKYLSTSKPWQEAYFAKLFNAVAIGFVCIRKLSKSLPNEKKSIR